MKERYKINKNNQKALFSEKIADQHLINKKEKLIQEQMKNQLRTRIKQPIEEPAKIVFILRHKMDRDH